MSKKISKISVVVLLLFFVLVAPTFAQDPSSVQPVNFFPLLPAALTLFMPLGLILLMSSAVPEAKAPATAINLLMVWAVAALAYFAVGFAFQFGGIAQVSPRPDFSGLYWEWYPLDQSVDIEVARLWGIIALRGWFLAGEAATSGALRLFLSHAALVGVMAMIPAAVLLDRNRRTAALLTGLFSGALIYPIAGNWLWGGGWLSHLGASLDLGHGLVDFGGASVIFLSGSGAALVALLVFKSTDPRETGDIDDDVVVTADQPQAQLTVYDPAETAAEEALVFAETTAMPSAYLPILSMLGGGLVLVGWFGLTSGVHAPTALNFVPGQAAVAGLLAALAGALTAAGYSAFTTQVFNPLMTARGLAAGLVAAVAAAPFAPIWVFVAAGLVMGLLVPVLIYLFDRRLNLSDNLGTLATYGAGGLVSLLLVAFFANGQAGQGWNGVGLTGFDGAAGQGVAGLIVASGGSGQLQAQLLGGGVILVWSMLVSVVLFQTITAVANAWARSGLEWADSRSQIEVTEVDAEIVDHPAEESSKTGQELAPR